MKAFLLVLFLSAPLPLFAAETPRVNKSKFFGVAIEGYDPVAYFDQKKPVKGDSDFVHEWSGATWRFASEENRRRFASAPEKFAPQYGGFCAYGVSQGYAVGIDPKAWSIVDGKLYLNYNLEVQKTWSKDTGKYIREADRNWPAVSKE